MNDNRALIVDDSRTACMMLSKALKKYGVESDLQYSGMEALEYLKHTRPSVIFMDQNMPGMDGVEVVKILKESNTTAAIPVFMYTSHVDDLFLARAKAAGAEDTLSKEFENEHIENILYRVNLLIPQNDTVMPQPREQPDKVEEAVFLEEAVAAASAASPMDTEKLVVTITEVVNTKIQEFYDSTLQTYWNEIWNANYDQREYYDAKLNDFCQTVVQPFVSQNLAEVMTAETKRNSTRQQELKNELNDYMGRKNREMHELKEQLERQQKQLKLTVFAFAAIALALGFSQWFF